jgi:hypothetical protein
VERRQHLARLRDLGRIDDLEEIAIDDGADAERDVVQLDSKTAVARRSWSSDGDAAGLKSHGESCRMRQNQAGASCARSQSRDT